MKIMMVMNIDRQIDRVVVVMMMYDIGQIKRNLTMITNDDVIFDDEDYIYEYSFFDNY